MLESQSGDLDITTLHQSLLNSLTEVREITDSWMNEYHDERPHESLND